jgi:inosose dehydratase
MHTTLDRRQFFQLTGLAAVAGALPMAPMAVAGGKKANLPLGIASYTFKEFKTADAIAMTQKLGVTKICFKSMHLPLESSAADIKSTAAQVQAAGIDLYAVGVIYMKNEQEVNQAFSYAQTAGVKIIVGVPNYELLSLCEKKVKETGIILAIHNHGPGDKLYPSPADVYKNIKNMDKRMGMCMDIGHTMRIAEDPTAAAKKYFDRLYDVHIKDVSAATKDGKTVEIGRGVIDIPKFIRTLHKLGYQGVLSLEYEKDMQDPLAGAAESIGYVRGVMATL